MIANEGLKDIILDVVDNQLKMEEPKCTTETFERLIISGYTEHEAKEQIAEVLLEEIYVNLKRGKEQFDEEKLRNQLNRIEGKEEPNRAPTESSKKAVTEIIKQIEYIADRAFPEEELKEIIARKEEAIPVLMDTLKRAANDPETYSSDKDYVGHIYAIYLLAQFKVTAVYPIVVELFSLPDEILHDLFGDTMVEDGGRILASICGNDLEPIKELIENEKIDEYVRAEAIQALAVLALNNNIRREEIIAYYRELFNKIENMTTLTLLISTVTDIYPGELYEEIKKAFKDEKVDTFLIDLKFVDMMMNYGKLKVLTMATENKQLQMIEDTISELKHWAMFKQESGEEFLDLLDFAIPLPKNPLNHKTIVNEVKVGRNDPCPCGSGKKYKKCCGR